MPLITALSFAAYIFAPSVFFVHNGDVKRRQSFVKLADSTYTTSRDRLDKLANEAEPDVNDRSFAREAIAWVVASRIGIAAALIFGTWTAIFASLGISVPAGSAASLRPKLLLRLVVPNKWFMALTPLFCLPYACLPAFIARLYKKYYLYEVTVGYEGIAPFWLLMILTAVGFGLLFAAAHAVSTLKVFLKWCNDNDYLVHPDVFKTQKTNFKKKAYNEIIALSESEIQKLMNHDLSDRPSLERVRDLFCLLCYTGQRFEDLINFDPKDIKNNAWDFISVKVKKRVIVPFEGYIAPAKDILERIGYSVPKISNQKFNEYIKTVGKLAGMDEIIKITRYSGKQKLVIEKRKYDFLSSHVGRRSMVTNLLSRNVPITLVQKLTAHSDIRTLMKYESANTDSLIDALNKF